MCAGSTYFDNLQQEASFITTTNDPAGAHPVLAGWWVGGLIWHVYVGRRVGEGLWGPTFQCCSVGLWNGCGGVTAGSQLLLGE
jgi:hypothetical protein